MASSILGHKWYTIRGIAMKTVQRVIAMLKALKRFVLAVLASAVVAGCGPDAATRQTVRSAELPAALEARIHSLYTIYPKDLTLLALFLLDILMTSE